MINRRQFMQHTAAISGTAFLATTAMNGLGPRLLAETSSPSTAIFPPGQPGADYTPVIVPNNEKLPWKIVDGVKVFHLIATEVDHEFAPGLRGKGWGYNGSIHGPTIEFSFLMEWMGLGASRSILSSRGKLTGMSFLCTSMGRSCTTPITMK